MRLMGQCNVDEKQLSTSQWLSISFPNAVRYFYPRIYEISDINKNVRLLFDYRCILEHLKMKMVQGQL